MVNTLLKKLLPSFISSNEKDMPPVDCVELSRSHIRVVPTRSGFLFLAVSVAVLLAAYNYKNSLVYFLGFLMISLFLINIVSCFRNLCGLGVSSASVSSTFVGEPASFPIRLEGRQRDYYGIRVDNEKNDIHDHDVKKGDEEIVELYRETSRRGWLSLEAFKLTSSYPLGLLRSSARVHLSQTVLIYPRPIDPKFSPPDSSVSGDKGEERVSETGDFNGVREYQAGDRMNQIAWKMVSKEQGMYCKQFAEPVGHSQLLSLRDLSQYSLETALSYLCHWVLQADQSGVEYGLDLGHVIQPLGSGKAHLTACLTLLGKV